MPVYKYCISPVILSPLPIWIGLFLTILAHTFIIILAPITAGQKDVNKMLWLSAFDLALKWLSTIFTCFINYQNSTMRSTVIFQSNRLYSVNYLVYYKYTTLSIGTIVVGISNQLIIWYIISILFYQLAL